MKVLEHEHPLELVDLQPPKIVDVWEEESDEDDDDLIIEEEFRRPCNRCYQDITVYHRYYYKCTLGSCDILLHKFCAELPPMLNHASHTHTLHQGNHDESWACEYCQSKHKTGEIGYSCPEEYCYYNIDVNCVIDVEKKSIHHPGHPHKLVCTISTPILCYCKACGRKHEGIFYSCTICFFTIHSDCAFLPKKMLIQKTTDDDFYHPHPLTISYSFPELDQRAKYYPKCRVCNDDFYKKSTLWIYKCEKCIYYAHVDCATSRREPFMSILSSTGSGRLVKNYKDADYPDLLHLPFPDESHNILKHLFFKNDRPGTSEADEVKLQHIKHQHEVILVDVQCIDSKVGSTSSNINPFMLHNPMKKIELLCNGCLRPIISMPFYKCAQSCSFALHEWCTRLPTSIENHPGHPQHTLTLLPNVSHKFFSIFRCEVCDLDCNGFAYGCVECEYYVDVSCGFIPEKITHKAHPNHLLSRVIVDNYDRWCHICRNEMYKDRFAFSCSICDNIFIHPECALLLPETIRHKIDKHPMSLSYLPIENHKSEYFCEICEDQLDPHPAFYHCHKCVWSVHSDCAPLILRSEMAMADTPYSWSGNRIYKFVNVKFGSIHETPGHPHPLSFTQGIASDGECSMCGMELRYEMIFKCLECKYAIDYDCCEDLNSS